MVSRHVLDHMTDSTNAGNFIDTPFDTIPETAFKIPTSEFILYLNRAEIKR